MAAEPRTIGRYALYGEIASGGMATVHLGRLMGPVGFSRTVAIKRLHPQFAKDPEFVAMFLEEARLAARIRHPNVVSTLDVVSESDELLLVLDFVLGESLARLIRASYQMSAPIPIPVVLGVMAGALDGLHAAHEARSERGEPLGIVHRDISPQNILVGADGVARVLDFGVAKATRRSEQTRAGMLKGKVAYMPPEQLKGGVVDRRADLYAASIVLWETLTGYRLFDGDDDFQIANKILTEDVDPPSRLRRDIPPALDALVLRGLSRQPQDRFATALDMVAAMETVTYLSSPREISRWIEQLAGPVIKLRSTMVTEVESGGDSAPAPAFTPHAPPRPGSLPGMPGPPVPSLPRPSMLQVRPPSPSLPGVPRPPAPGPPRPMGSPPLPQAPAPTPAPLPAPSPSTPLAGPPPVPPPPPSPALAPSQMQLPRAPVPPPISLMKSPSAEGLPSGASLQRNIPTNTLDQSALAANMRERADEPAELKEPSALDEPDLPPRPDDPPTLPPPAHGALPGFNAQAGDINGAGDAGGGYGANSAGDVSGAGEGAPAASEPGYEPDGSTADEAPQLMNVDEATVASAPLADYLAMAGRTGVPALAAELPPEPAPPSPEPSVRDTPDKPETGGFAQVSSVALVSPIESARPPRPWLRWGAVAGAVVVASVVALLVMRPSRDDKHDPASGGASETPSQQASSAPSAPVESPPPTTAEPPPSADPPPPASVEPVKTPPRVTPPSQPKTKNCNPPYTIDKRGIKRLKPECL